MPHPRPRKNRKTPSYLLLSLKDPPACYSPWTPLSSHQWDNFSPPQWYTLSTPLSGDLISFTLPYTPIFYNPDFRHGLAAKDLRHGTTWYDAEQKWLTDVRKANPELQSTVDYLRLELEAVFYKQIESMGLRKPTKKAKQRFQKEYDIVAGKGITLPLPEDFLKSIEWSDYLGSHLKLEHRIAYAQ